MANKKISELDELVAPSLTDVFPIVNGGDTKKVKLSTVKESLGINGLNNVTKWLTATHTSMAMINVDIANTLEIGMIMYIKVPNIGFSNSAQFSIDGVNHYVIQKNGVTMSGLDISNKYLTLRFDGTYWQCEDLNTRVSNIENDIGDVDALTTNSKVVVGAINEVKGKVDNAETDIDKLENITKFISATATTNGDFKVNITNTLATGMIVYIAFPTATVNTASARLSIDNGTTYKNVLNILASEIENRNVCFRYDGTNWQLNSIVNHTNSNGSYTLFPDGSMISMQKKVFTNIAVNTANGSLFINLPFITLNNFPKNFASIPNVCNCIHAGSLTMIAEADNPTVSNPGSVFIVRTVGTASLSGEIHTSASGKWK